MLGGYEGNLVGNKFGFDLFLHAYLIIAGASTRLVSPILGEAE